jgi:broad specificity phosphatase PhoE
VRVTTLLLARHGETDWNRARRWQGHADRPLTGRGRAQATALAERLADIALDAVYSSDLRRARETAEAVAQTQGLDVVQLPELREVSVGSWEGLTRDEAEAKFPDGFRRWLAGGTGWDDGETYAAMNARVLGAVNRIARDHEGEQILIVSHGGPIRAIHGAALGMDVEDYRRIRPVEPNARLSAVSFQDGRLTELSPAGEIDALLLRDHEEDRKAASGPPSPAG